MNARQHESHQDLLAHFDAGDAPRARRWTRSSCPTDVRRRICSRPSAWPSERDVYLLLLCSLRANASSAALAAKRAGVRAHGHRHRSAAPGGRARRSPRTSSCASRRFHRQVDTSLKRNLGLLHRGPRRLEADPLPRRRHRAAQPRRTSPPRPGCSTSTRSSVWRTRVCRTTRSCATRSATSARRRTRSSAAARSSVGEAAFSSFFPNIYNEDWFFLLDGHGLRPSAVTGTAIQNDYDPYHDARRARGEELGDTLAEGVFGLLDNGLRPGGRRRGVLARVPARPAADHPARPSSRGAGLGDRAGAEGEDGRCAQGGDRPQPT